MPVKIFLVMFLVAVCYAQEYYKRDSYLQQRKAPQVRVRRQFFGGRQDFPGGGFNQRAGYQSGRTWGSISQSGDARRMDPITFSGGSGFGLPGGHSITGALDHQPGVGSHANIRGTANLFSNDRHQVSAWAQHDRNFDRNFKSLGPGTNSAGVDYAHKSGVSAFLSGSKTPGGPAMGSVGATVPIAKLGPNVNVDAFGRSDFRQGMKPTHQVGLQIAGTF